MSTYLITKYNYRTCFQNEEICSIVYEILHMLHQKSANQHRKFAQLRKELLIVSTCTPHGARFKWGGIFYIDRAQFVRFIRAGYSVLTFLLNFHSWWSFEVFSDCNLPIKCSIKFNQMFALFFFSCVFYEASWLRHIFSRRDTKAVKINPLPFSHRAWNCASRFTVSLISEISALVQMWNSIPMFFRAPTRAEVIVGFPHGPKQTFRQRWRRRRRTDSCH